MPRTYSLTSAEEENRSRDTSHICTFYKQDCFLWAKRHYIIHLTIFLSRKSYCLLWPRRSTKGCSQRSVTALCGNRLIWLRISERGSAVPASPRFLSRHVQLVLGPGGHCERLRTDVYLAQKQHESRLQRTKQPVSSLNRGNESIQRSSCFICMHVCVCVYT